MNTIAKVLIPNKEWLLRNEQEKIGTITKAKKGYAFLHKGITVNLTTLNEIKSQFGITSFDENTKKNKVDTLNKVYTIYDFPCSSAPFEPMYSIKEKRPLYTKSAKSKSQYCAGHYIIKFKKSWVKSFCPKLITLERNVYHGPFKTEYEVRVMLATLNKV